MATGLYVGTAEIGTAFVSVPGTTQQGSSIVYGHVIDVILDGANPDEVGCIRFKNLQDQNADEDTSTDLAHPIDRTNYTVPLPGEQVIIVPAYGPNVNGLYAPRYYYITTVSMKDVVNDNITPFLGGTGGGGSNLSKLKKQLKELFGPVAANRFLSKIKHDQKTLQRKTVQEQPSEGDKIIQGRYGGVIKFTSTIDKDEEQRNVFPTQGSPDGDPLLIIKNNRREIVDGNVYKQDEPNIEDVVTYYTTSQKIPIKLGCSKNLYTWNPNIVGGIQKTTAAINALNKEIQVEYHTVPIAIIDLAAAGIVPVDVSSITDPKERFRIVTSRVIQLLEGGYYNPAWHKVNDKRYGSSGETLYGIDRVAGDKLNTTTLGTQFWKLVDANKNKETWVLFYMPESPLAEKLQFLVADMIYDQYVANLNAHGTSELIKAINEDPRLMFHYSYASWNGSGWFKKFAQDAVEFMKSNSGYTKDDLLNYCLNKRLTEGLVKGLPPNSLISQGGTKIKQFINSLFITN